MDKLFFILFLVCSIAKAQVLLPTTETAFEKQHQFNPDVIKANNIRRITFDILDKKDFEVAIDKSLIESYDFDTNGKLSRYYFTTIIQTVEKEITTPPVYRKRRKISNGGTRIINFYVYDTVSTSYFYNNDRLILKRYHDGFNYYESRYYRYDSVGNLTKELRFKETNNSKDKSIFILGNQVLLSEDSFQYTKYSSGQTKCTYINNENRSYKEVVTNYDSLGRKKEIFENYTVASWIMQEHRFEYDGKRLSKAKFKGNANNTVDMTITYEYDKKNEELYTEKHFKGDYLVKEISYITDSNNDLLNSFIIRDPNAKTMRIVKLKYDLGSVSKTEQ
ncbi:MAG: hypothetical protein H0W73_09110 [Bacteroidetes bacterium]|nr:hypothetical protein [Bacteroidota bacterium]